MSPAVEPPPEQPIAHSVARTSFFMGAPCPSATRHQLGDFGCQPSGLDTGAEPESLVLVYEYAPIDEVRDSILVIGLGARLAALELAGVEELLAEVVDA